MPCSRAAIFLAPSSSPRPGQAIGAADLPIGEECEEGGFGLFRRTMPHHFDQAGAVSARPSSGSLLMSDDLAHPFPEAEGTHVRPDLLDVGEAFFLRPLFADFPPARRVSRSANQIEYCSSWFTTTL